MSSVKRSQPWASSLIVGALALTGCESGDLARFAPPGIVKYEDLAGDQEVNPAVAARIAERREEKGAGSFPNLSLTPGKGDRPQKKPVSEVAAETDMLVDARTALAEDVASDRAAVEAELGRDLSAEGEALKSRLDADSAAAARERREALTPPETEN